MRIYFFPLFQKLHERQSTLKKSTLPEKEKEKWNKVLISDLMSSEESDDENGETIIVKPLVWRSERVTRFLHQLNEKCSDSKTTQAKHRRKQCIDSSDISIHPKPVMANLPSWAFRWTTRYDYCIWQYVASPFWLSSSSYLLQCCIKDFPVGNTYYITTLWNSFCSWDSPVVIFIHTFLIVQPFWCS